MNEEEGLNAEATDVTTQEPTQSGETGQATQAPQAQTQQAQPVTAPPAATQPNHSVDLPAFLRVRDEAKEAKREAETLRRQLAEIERRNQEARAQAPDMFADPEGYHAYWEDRIVRTREEIAAEFETQLIEDRVANSAEKWREKLGADKWSELDEWLGTLPPQAIQSFRRERDPYGAAHARFRQTRTAQRLGDRDIDQLIEEEVAKRLAAASQQTQAPAAAPENGALNGQNAQPRDASGRYAPSPQPQSTATRRPSAPSLATVEGAPSTSTDSGSGYHAAFGRK